MREYIQVAFVLDNQQMGPKVFCEIADIFHDQ